jgi:subtilisin family serine protease
MSAEDGDGEPRRTKAVTQAELVVAAFREAGIDIGVATFDDSRTDIDFIYQQRAILVRDAYLEQVRAVVGGGEILDGFVDGVTLFSLDGAEISDVLAALDAIDDRLGAGVATPNHVLSISPVYMCPATEPDEPPGDRPEPGVCGGGAGGGVLVQVVDTGLLPGAAGHSWLAGVTGDPDQFTAPDIPPYTGHGTFVAGVARCMAPASQMHVANVLHYAGAQLEHEIIKHVDAALGTGCDIISLSAGATSRKNIPPLGFEALWQRYRHHKGVLLVAAAGNNSSRRPFWPAAFPQVVSAGALAANWRSRAPFSDYGGWVDVYAPGEGLVNAYATGTYLCREPPNTGQVRHFHGMARWSGTSFSTPMVAGLIAARMSRTGENSRRAGAALLAAAREQALPGVGPVVYPCDEGDGCADHDHHHRGGRCHHGSPHRGGHHGGGWQHDGGCHCGCP